MGAVPAFKPTVLNQAGQDALKQGLQGVSFSNSVPAPQDPAAQYKAAANAFTASHWTNGTANGLTPSQNLANVVNQPGNPVAQNPTPYIQGVLGQAAQVPKPQGTFNPPSSAGDGNSAPMGAVPPPSAPSAPKFDAAGIAASRVAAQRAALAGSVAAYDTSRKQGFDYATKNTQDQRVLDAAMFHEQNNPFSGKYQYDKTNILRNNNIQDTQNQMQYNNDIAASDAKLAAFDAGSAGLQQDIQQQLEHQNLQDNIAQAPYTGMLNGEQTQQAQAQGFNQNLQQNQNNFNQNLQTSQFNQQAQNQQFNQGLQTKQFNAQQAQLQWDNTFKNKQFDQNVAQQVWDNTFKDNSFKQSVNQFAQQMGLDYSRLDQSQQQFVADQAFKNKSLELQNNPNTLDNQYKQTEIDKNKAALAGGAPDSKNSIDSTYVSNLSAMTPDKRDLFFKNEKANIIKDLGISGYNQLYSMYYDQYGAPKQ